VRIFKSKWFSKFARKGRITDAQLCEVIRDTEQGIVDANYGDGVIKQRIARQNEGKSGGYRSVILYRQGDKAFFVYGFAKSERANIGDAEELEFKKMAKVTFAFSEDELLTLLETGVFVEVMDNV
jgi:hypothetical protein